MSATASPDPTLIKRLLDGRQRSDPAADRVVETFRSLRGGEGWALLDAALDGGDRHAIPDLPPALHDLLAPIQDPPSWFDPELADAGALTFWKGGSIPVSLTLFSGSLAFGYQSASLVRPLAATGRLEQMASRRLGETARWVLDVTTPGGMHPGAPGIASTIRVRLVHALVRDRLLRDGWDVEEWGIPISASDMFATGIAGFHVVPLRAMADLGVRYSAAELEAHTHLWRWISYVMGTPEDLLPSSYREAVEMVDTALAHDPGPNEDSPKLMRALLHHGVPLDRFLPGPASIPAEFLATQVLGGLARRWMGDEMADRLDVPSNPLRHLIPALRPLFLAREALTWTGLLGSEEHLAAREIAAVKRTLRQGRAAGSALAPSEAAREPVLQRAA